MKWIALHIQSLAIAAITLLTSACAPVTSMGEPSYQIQSFQFINQTRREIRNVRLWVDDIRGLVQCGVIPAGSLCATGFQIRDYQGREILISWTSADGQEHQSEPFRVKPPADLVPEQPLKGSIIIGQDGTISALLSH